MAKSTAQAQIVRRFKQLKLIFMAQQATRLVDDCEQTEWNQAHIEKENHLKINRPDSRNH